MFLRMIETKEDNVSTDEITTENWISNYWEKNIRGSLRVTWGILLSRVVDETAKGENTIKTWRLCYLLAPSPPPSLATLFSYSGRVWNIEKSRKNSGKIERIRKPRRLWDQENFRENLRTTDADTRQKGWYVRGWNAAMPAERGRGGEWSRWRRWKT